MKITWKDKEINLIPLTINDIVEFEDRVGTSITSLQGKLSMKHARTLVHIGIKKVVPEVTEDEVGNWPLSDAGTWGAVQGFLLAASTEAS